MNGFNLLQPLSSLRRAVLPPSVTFPHRASSDVVPSRRDGVFAEASLLPLFRRRAAFPDGMGDECSPSPAPQLSWHHRVSWDPAHPRGGGPAATSAPVPRPERHFRGRELWAAPWPRGSGGHVPSCQAGLLVSSRAALTEGTSSLGDGGGAPRRRRQRGPALGTCGPLGHEA